MSNIEVEDGVDVVCGADRGVEDEVVIALASEFECPSAAVEGVIAAEATDRVIAATAVDAVGAVAASDCLGQFVAGEV